jgi:DNA topoisomerase-1
MDSQMVRISNAAWKYERVEIIRIRIIDREIGPDRPPGVVVNTRLDRIEGQRREYDLGAAFLKDLPRTEKLPLLEAVGCDNQDSRVGYLHRRASFLLAQELSGSFARLGGQTSRVKKLLRHSCDAEPGIRRKRMGRYWAYFDAAGHRVTDRGEIDRLNSIGLPPAYADAWFCADPNGHLQATGIDARGRKQYRYHLEFRAKRDAAKFEKLLQFGKILPRLRRRIEQDLKRRDLTREAVLAAVVRLLDTEHIRIGSEEYAKQNKSFGATTLRARHLKRTGHGLMMRFTGKHAIVHEVKITDTNLKRICKRCQELPGQMLFQYVNGDGDPKPITSTDVNDYIKEVAGDEFTAKHFRTWSASVIACDQMLKKAEDARISVKTVIEPVAEALGNTPAISRKSYVHPKLLEAVKSKPRDPLSGMERPKGRNRLSTAEVALLQFLARLKVRNQEA